MKNYLHIIVFFVSINLLNAQTASIGSMGIEDSYIDLSMDDVKSQFRFTDKLEPFQPHKIERPKFTFNNSSLIVYNSFGQAIKEINNIMGQSVIYHPNGISNRYNLKLDYQPLNLPDKFIIAKF